MKVSFLPGHPRQYLLIAIALCVVIGGGIMGGRWLYYRMTHVQTDDARVDGEVITLSSRVAGWITSLPVIEGDPVQAGQVLATIDDRNTRLKREALAAQLESNERQYQALEAEIRQIDATTDGALNTAAGKLEAATAARETARHKLELAHADFKRTEDLAEKKFISPQALDTARTNLASATAELRRTEGEIMATRGALATARGDRDRLAVLRAQMQANASDAKQIRAQIAALDTEINDRTIRSPVSGGVVTTFTREREYVTAGQRLLMVHDPKDQWIEANIKETDIGLVKAGQPVEIKVAAYPDRLYLGHVSRIGGAATSKFALLPDPNPSGNFTRITQRIPVRITLDAAAPELRSGMMVDVAIDHRDR